MEKERQDAQNSMMTRKRANSELVPHSGRGRSSTSCELSLNVIARPKKAGQMQQQVAHLRQGTHTSQARNIHAEKLRGVGGRRCVRGRRGRQEEQRAWA